jgi:hypothetical protein
MLCKCCYRYGDIRPQRPISAPHRSLRCLTLALVYESHEALPRLTKDTPSMRVTEAAIKQVQRPDLPTILNGAVSVRRNAEREQRRNYR